MTKKTVLPKCCPVCGGDSLQPIERHTLGTNEAETKSISGLLGFRCGNGHSFLIGDSDLIKNPQKSAQQDSKGDMSQRSIRVVKWLSSTPVVGVCTVCGREFKVPMTALTRTGDALKS
jgi:hypothetical protein